MKAHIVERSSPVGEKAQARAVLCPDPECALPAEIEHRWVWGSTDGPVEMVKTRCEGGCWYTVLATDLRELE